MLNFIRTPLRWVWIRRRVRWVALAANSPEKLAARAHTTASQFRDGDLRLLSSIINGFLTIPPGKGLASRPVPSDFTTRKTPLRRALCPVPPYGEELFWESALYLAAFEIFYSLSEGAVSELERISADCDCFRSSAAFITLIVLATEGVCEERITPYLKRKLRDWDYEELDNLMPSLGRLSRHSECMKKGLIDFLTYLGSRDPIGELECLSTLLPHAPEVVKARSSALEAIMQEPGPVPCDLALGLKEAKAPQLILGEHTYPQIPTSQAITAALIFSSIFPEHQYVKEALDYWERKHPVSTYRNKIFRFQSDV